MAVERFADDLEDLSEEQASIQVEISYDVIKLLSEQLYASPLKAIEELVVNSWDAEASRCSVLVNLDADRPLIAVFDDGHGMNTEELKNLWHIGVSNKTEIASNRKQIGKFGIGKLASYAVARRATYVSKSAEGIYAVSINFEDFADATTEHGTTDPITLKIRRVDSPESLLASRSFQRSAEALRINGTDIDLDDAASWTLVILEDLKERAYRLEIGRLRWVLQTAMPLATDFALYLNSEIVRSSKESYKKTVEFRVDELDDFRLQDLSAVTGETWERKDGCLVSPSFPSGISGEVYVTERSLYSAGGKSEDLGRSHGFFVRVHNRLINETDPLFGARPLSFKTWNRFAAIIEADDLNPYITASRDDIEQSDIKRELRSLLIQLFNQARDRHTDLERQRESDDKKKKEGERDGVSPDLVERPLADALSGDRDGGDNGAAPNHDSQRPSNRWIMLDEIEDLASLQELIDQLYSTQERQQSYQFAYSPSGREGPAFRFNANTATFTLNEDHELVQEYSEEPGSRHLLETVAVAETLLEVYLREAAIDGEVVAEILERRDTLLRALAQDESYSLTALAASVRESADVWRDLEVALVGALRALGFSARHISGSGTPDGLANYEIHGAGSVSFTLEAKSSKDVPELSQLDFAGLRSHYEAAEADGCLLVAPTYPGIDDEESEVATRARQQRVSCWTIEQLATVVEAAERREINAVRLQDIVLRSFAPTDVASSIAELLSPSYDNTDLYSAILDSLVGLEGRLPGTPRNVSLVAGEVSRLDAFGSIELTEISDALVALARSSKGMLHVKDSGEVVVMGQIDELRRRLSHMTGETSGPRRRGTFRQREE